MWDSFCLEPLWKKLRKGRLNKKASLGWLISQFEAIIEFHEPKEEQAEEET